VAGTLALRAKARGRGRDASLALTGAWTRLDVLRRSGSCEEGLYIALGARLAR
jgi:hypothetical protein